MEAQSLAKKMGIFADQFVITLPLVLTHLFQDESVSMEVLLYLIQQTLHLGLERNDTIGCLKADLYIELYKSTFVLIKSLYTTSGCLMQDITVLHVKHMHR